MVGFSTGYVTFDGSNNGTDSRNLTVTTEQVTPTVDVPFGLNLGTADTVVLKNLIIKNIVAGQTNFRYGAVINDKNGVYGFRVENCQIGTVERPVRRDGLAPWGATSANQFAIINNEIYCGTRGIATLYLVDSEITGNTINLMPTTAVNTNNYIHGIYITGASGTTIIHDNTINNLEKANVSGTYLMGIAFAGNEYATKDIISVVNNMVNVGAADEVGSTYGIGLRSAGNMGNLKVYHNTIVINNNASTLKSCAVGNHTNGTGPVNIDLKNNIIIINHTGNTTSSAIGLVPTTSILTSDYNLLVSNQNFVNYQGTNYADLVTWQATAQDAHSVSKAVEFTGTSDLHLAGASIGDDELGAPAIEGITTDIDGDARHAFAYKGADEASIELFPPEVSVTLLANTAGVPDTMQTYSTVQIRGSWPFTWDNTSQGVMTSIGGDYWSYTYNIPRDSLQKNFEYKFCTFPVDLARLTSEMNGWESANNRVLDMKAFAGTDTTLPLQYVDGWKSGGEYSQFDKPFTTTDSIDVYVRVDAEALIKAQAFDPTTEKIGLRGSNAFDSWSGTTDFNWSKTLYFTQEKAHTNGIWGSTYNGTYFFNGVIRCPQEWAGREIQYKFLIGDAWGRNEDNNRSAVLPADGSDVTVHWVWYNNVPPAGFTGQDTSDVTFSANMTKAIENNGFEIGDTLLVKYGYFGSSVEVKTDTLRRLSGSENYFVTVNDIPLSFGEPLYYQYYMIKNTAEQREVYFNFEYTGSVASEAERRAFTVTSVTTVIGDIQDSDVDARRMPIFRNNQLLSQAVTLTVECDLRPAIFQVKAGSTLDDIQSSFDITPAMLTEKPDTVFTLGLYMNGPLSNNAEGTWATWGGTLAADTTRKMYDNGTHGDIVAGDTVYTLTYHLDPAQNHRVGQEFKYGIGGGDNESGYGLNHIENIDDTNPTYTLYTQWGSINPNFYDAWDFDNPHPRNDIRKDNIPLVTKYALDQNFPNPFNPTTQIRFAVPERSDATLTIYNALGQMVNKVVFTNLNNGVYSYFWDGKDLRGNNVASGVYLYELRAGDKFRDLKKMVLLK